MLVEVPKHPTHAVRHVDNWDGERDVVYAFAFKVDDEFFDWESGKPLLEYEGDEILDVWELRPEVAYHSDHSDVRNCSGSDDRSDIEGP